MTEEMPDNETDTELAAWAAGVIACVTPEELSRLVKDYRELSQNKRRSAADREFARRRWKALSKKKHLPG